MVELIKKLKREIVVTGIAAYESVTTSSFEHLLQITSEIGCRLLLDISDHFELSSLPTTNGVFKYLAGNPLPSHAAIVYSLLKNKVYSDLELAFVISEDEAVFKALCKTVVILQGSTPIISQYYYGYILHELLAFQPADRHPPSQRVSGKEGSSVSLSILSKWMELRSLNESDENQLLNMDVDQSFLPITKPVRAAIFENFARQNITEAETDVTAGFRDLIRDSYGFPFTSDAEFIYAASTLSLFNKLVLCCIQDGGTLCFPKANVSIVSEWESCFCCKFPKANVSIVPTEPADGYKWTEKSLSAAMETVEKPWIYISGPTISPTGLVYTNEEITKLLSLCAKFDARVILDTSFSGVEFNSKSGEGWNLEPIMKKLSSANSSFCVALLGSLFSKLLTGGIRFSFLLINQASFAEMLHSSGGSSKPHRTIRYAVKKLLGLGDEHKTDLLKALSQQKEILGSRYNQLKQVLEDCGWEVLEAEAGISVLAKPKAYLGKTVEIQGGDKLEEVKVEDSNIREAMLKSTGLCINSCLWAGVPGFCCFRLRSETSDFERALNCIRKFNSLLH